MLYRAVYPVEGEAQLMNLMHLLLSALERNPHNMEAWELIATNIGLGLITDDVWIAKAFSMLRPLVSEYPILFETFLSTLQAKSNHDSIPPRAECSSPSNQYLACST